MSRVSGGDGGVSVRPSSPPFIAAVAATVGRRCGRAGRRQLVKSIVLVISTPSSPAVANTEPVRPPVGPPFDQYDCA